jgi:hypothetical protein
MRMSILVDILLNRKTILAVVGQGVCWYVLIFLPMDGHTYTVEIQTESYVTRYEGMILFWLPMDNALDMNSVPGNPNAMAHLSSPI